jgi:hypothetical protein
MHLFIVFNPKNNIIPSTIDCCVDSFAVLEGQDEDKVAKEVSTK